MKVTTGYIDCNDIRIFYRDIGNGSPLLLLHGGLLTGMANWGRHYHWLSKHFRVISLDHRGHGRTNNPSGRFESYGALAADVSVFLEKLDLPETPVVMGLSSGAAIALHLAARHPEHVKKLILIGIHSNLGKSEKYKRGLEEFYFTDDYKKPPRKWDHVRHRPLDSLAYWWYHREVHWYRLLTSAWEMWVKEFDLTDEEYANICVPTLIVAGSRDDFGSVKDFQDLHERIKGSQLEILECEDHIFVIDRPVRVTRDVVCPFLLPRAPAQRRYAFSSRESTT